ncbi:MAG: prolipoprotein diacylglyceryl transferase [Parcubacteria group bacterium]
MENFLSNYQHLPYHINPIAIQIGSFQIHWYSLMYLIAFLIVYLLLIYRIKKKEGGYKPGFVLDFLLYAIAGLLIGARLGYVLFYNLPFFISHPLAIFYPFDMSENYVGISGMSFFGGMIGIVLAGIIFVYLRGLASLNQNLPAYPAGGQRKPSLSNNFFRLADFVVPAIPAGYFFGRIGNFLNGELYGRITQKPWGMYFPLDLSGLLRHPSQLYEAFFEGLVIFVILWTIRNKSKFTGQLLLTYLFLYGLFRFFIEFFREPDPQIGLVFSFFTLGQIFSSLLMVVAIAIYFLKKNTFRTVDKCGV